MSCECDVSCPDYRNSFGRLRFRCPRCEVSLSALRSHMSPCRSSASQHTTAQATRATLDASRRSEHRGNRYRRIVGVFFTLNPRVFESCRLQYARVRHVFVYKIQLHCLSSSQCTPRRQPVPLPAQWILIPQKDYIWICSHSPPPPPPHDPPLSPSCRPYPRRAAPPARSRLSGYRSAVAPIRRETAQQPVRPSKLHHPRSTRGPPNSPLANAMSQRFGGV